MPVYGGIWRYMAVDMVVCEGNTAENVPCVVITCQCRDEDTCRGPRGAYPVSVVQMSRERSRMRQYMAVHERECS